MPHIHRKRFIILSLGLLGITIVFPLLLSWREIRQKWLNTNLIAAISQNDVKATVASLDSGADPEACVPDHTPALWDQIRYLWHMQSPPPCTALTPLEQVVFNPSEHPLSSVRLVMAKALLDHGARVDKRSQGDYRSYTPLMLAAGNGDRATVRLLLDRGADINANDARLIPGQSVGETALSCAARNGHTDVVKDLLDRGADINTPSDRIYTPLMLAAAGGHEETVKLLLARHADVNIKKIGAWGIFHGKSLPYYTALLLASSPLILVKNRWVANTTGNVPYEHICKMLQEAGEKQ